MDATPIGHRAVVSVICLMMASGAVLADSRQLRAVAVAPEHDPLFIDDASVRRSGTEVSLRYVLNVPVALEAPAATRRWRSNEMEAVIDCASRTYSIGNVTAHAGPGRTGNVVGRYSSTMEERKPAPIVRASTFDYLARDLCAPMR